MTDECTRPTIHTAAFAARDPGGTCEPASAQRPIEPRSPDQRTQVPQHPISSIWPLILLHRSELIAAIPSPRTQCTQAIDFISIPQ